MFVDLLNILTIIWLAIWSLFAVRRLASGNRDSILYLLIVHFILCGIPLLLDEVLGEPAYLDFPGFYIASRDENTAVIYCFYVSMVPVFWWLVGRASAKIAASIGKDSISEVAISGALRRFRPIFWIFLISPLIGLAFAPEPDLYLNYGWVATAVVLRPEVLEHRTTVAFLCTMSLLSAAGILAGVPRLRIFHFLFVLPWVALAVWLNGKRHLFVFAAALVWFVLYWKGDFLRGSRFIFFGLFLVIVILTFSYAYQETIRGVEPTRSIDQFYQDFRINYGRDDVIKMTIFAELHPEMMQILEYRGQSLIFYATMYVRRSFWPDKPFPYAQYFTSALFLLRPRLLGWGMTTTWLEEAVANFSWFGLILGPLLPAMICRIGDNNANALVYPLTVFVSSLFISVEFAAFAPVFYVWVLMILHNRWYRRKSLRQGATMAFANQSNRQSSYP